MSCNDCIYENIKNSAWSSSQPHPCNGCKRLNEPQDNYTPSVDSKEYEIRNSN